MDKTYRELCGILTELSIKIDDVLDYVKFLLEEEIDQYRMTVYDFNESVTLSPEEMIRRVNALQKEIILDIKKLDEEKYSIYLQKYIMGHKISDNEIWELGFIIDKILTKLNFNDPAIKAVITSQWGTTKGVNRSSEEKCVIGYIKKLNSYTKDRNVLKGIKTWYVMARNSLVAKKQIINTSYDKLKRK